MRLFPKNELYHGSVGTIDSFTPCLKYALMCVDNAISCCLYVCSLFTVHANSVFHQNENENENEK